MHCGSVEASDQLAPYVHAYVCACMPSIPHAASDGPIAMAPTMLAASHGSKRHSWYAQFDSALGAACWAWVLG